MQRLLLVGLFSLAAVSAPPTCVSQVAPSTVELHAEAVAIGAALTVPSGTTWSVGLDVSVGKHAVVDVTDEGAGLDTYATGYLVVRWTPNADWQAALSPIGVAAVVGNDFGAAYPSARLGISYFWRRVGAGSELRVVRIASGGGTGDYWIQWVPVRVAVRL